VVDGLGVPKPIELGWLRTLGALLAGEGDNLMEGKALFFCVSLGHVVEVW
jgi:hypothetical protein